MIVALHEPEIPQNTGAVARLCAATGTPLHLIGRLGFSLRHPDARRVGMDYWESVELHRHLSFADFVAALPDQRILAWTTRASVTLWNIEFRSTDVLLFGPESRGLPADLLTLPDILPVRVPMLPGVRSLNLATTVAISLYEGMRQTAGGDLESAGLDGSRQEGIP